MEPVYPVLYEMLQNFLFGSVELTAHMEFMLTFLSTLGCVAVMAVPFALVWCAIKSIFEVIFR